MTSIPSVTENHKDSFSLEFWLLIGFLITLVIVIIIVVIFPIWGPLKPETLDATLLIKYRQDALSLILTVFGVWIGAGAAYFFGKENLQVATRGMLDIYNLSNKERLKTIYVKDRNPRKIEDTFLLSTKLVKLYSLLKERPNWWFFIITDDNKKLLNSINEEALYLYINEKLYPENGVLTEKLEENTVEDLLNYINEETNDNNRLQKYSNIHLEITMGYTIGLVNDLMLQRDKFLSIITDEDRIPTHYLTTDDIRRCMLEM